MAEHDDRLDPSSPRGWRTTRGAPGFAALAELHRRAGASPRPSACCARVSRSVADDHARARAARARAGRHGPRGPRRAASSSASAARLVAADELAQRRSRLRPTRAQRGRARRRLRAGRDRRATQLIDPNRVAAEAILQADAGAAEGLREDAAESAYAPGRSFVTETMARLLDRQGDARGAARIRAALSAETPAAARSATGARAARASRPSPPSSVGSPTCGETGHELRIDSPGDRRGLRRRHRRRADGQRRHPDRRVRRADATPTVPLAEDIGVAGVEFGRILEETRKAADALGGGAVVETLVVLARFSLIFRGVDDETFLVVARDARWQPRQGALSHAPASARDPPGALSRSARGARGIPDGRRRAAHPRPARTEPQPARHARARDLRHHHARGHPRRARRCWPRSAAPSSSSSSRTTRARWSTASRRRRAGPTAS